MWSVWSNKADIYIGATFSLLRVSGAPAVVVRYAATLSIGKVLMLISDRAKSQHITLKNTKLRVVIGSQICAPIYFPVPEGLKNWNEAQQLAASVASQNLGIPTQEFQCEFTTSAPSSIAAIPLWWIDALQAWAVAEKTKINSLKPLWVWASKSQRALKPSATCLYIVEESCITVMAASESLIGHCVQFNNPYDAQNWLSDQNHSADATVRLHFKNTAQFKDANMPVVFQDHWSVD